MQGQLEHPSIVPVYDLGVRESRRIIGDYTLDVEDMRSERHFPDVVAMGAYPPDKLDALTDWLAQNAAPRPRNSSAQITLAG